MKAKGVPSGYKHVGLAGGPAGGHAHVRDTRSVIRTVVGIGTAISGIVVGIDGTLIASRALERRTYEIAVSMWLRFELWARDLLISALINPQI